jgi:hypothetical protein
MRDGLPSLSELLIQDLIAWLVHCDQPPKFVGVVHVNAVGELMNHRVAHEVGRNKEQLGVEREVLLSGETSPPGALALD